MGNGDEGKDNVHDSEGRSDLEENAEDSGEEVVEDSDEVAAEQVDQEAAEYYSDEVLNGNNLHQDYDSALEPVPEPTPVKSRKPTKPAAKESKPARPTKSTKSTKSARAPSEAPSRRSRGAAPYSAHQQQGPQYNGHYGGKHPIDQYINQPPEHGLPPHEVGRRHNYPPEYGLPPPGVSQRHPHPLQDVNESRVLPPEPHQSAQNHARQTTSEIPVKQAGQKTNRGPARQTGAVTGAVVLEMPFDRNWRISFDDNTVMESVIKLPPDEKLVSNAGDAPLGFWSKGKTEHYITYAAKKGLPNTLIELFLVQDANWDKYNAKLGAEALALILDQSIKAKDKTVWTKALATLIWVHIGCLRDVAKKKAAGYQPLAEYLKANTKLEPQMMPFWEAEYLAQGLISANMGKGKRKK